MGNTHTHTTRITQGGSTLLASLTKCHRNTEVTPGNPEIFQVCFAEGLSQISEEMKVVVGLPIGFSQGSEKPSSLMLSPPAPPASLVYYPGFAGTDEYRHYLSGGASLEPSSAEKGVGDPRGMFAWFPTPKPQTLKPDLLGCCRRPR